MSNQTAWIMLLDSHADHISVLKDMLNTGGMGDFNLHTVDRIDTALEWMNSQPCDVFIIDMETATKNEEQLIETVRLVSPEIPVILLVSNEVNQPIDPSIEKTIDNCFMWEYLQGDIIVRAVICAVEKRRFLKNLLATQNSIQRIIEQIVDGILIVGENATILYANIYAESIFGCSRGALVGTEFQYPLVSNGKMQIEITREEAKPLIVEMYIVPTEWQRKSAFMVILRDITEQQKAQERLRLSAQVFETTAEGIFITDAHSNIISTNQAFTDITGYQLSEIIGKNALQFHSDRRDYEFFNQTWNSIAITGRWQGEVWNRRKDGEIYPEWVTISTVKNDLGDLSNYIVIFTDISSRKQSEKRLIYLATHDPLTDLANRELFYDRLEQALMRSRRNRAGNSDRWMIAMMLLDLDGFKAINDTLGHDQGDQILQIVAQRLQSCVRMSDSVARLGGDEFTIIIENLIDARSPTLVAQKVLKSISQPFLLSGQEYSITASIGISVYPQDGEDSTSLLKNADIAMYRAKDKHNTFEYFS